MPVGLLNCAFPLPGVPHSKLKTCALPEDGMHERKVIKRAAARFLPPLQETPFGSVIGYSIIFILKEPQIASFTSILSWTCDSQFVGSSIKIASSRLSVERTGLSAVSDFVMKARAERIIVEQLISNPHMEERW